MKILHINDYPTDAGGGAEVVMSQTIDLLRSQGHAVETFTGADLADTRRTPLTYLDNAGARRALAAKLSEFRPQVVHLHNWYHLLSPGILAELATYKLKHPVRVVMTAHDYHLVSPNSAGGWFSWWTGRRNVIELDRLGSLGYLLTRSWDHRSCLHSCLKLVLHGWHYGLRGRHRVIDHVICPSRFVQKMLASTGLQTSWLPHPCERREVRNEGRGDCISRPSTLRFVFAGRIEPEKGLHEFLLALPTDFDAALTIIGTGGELARCRAVCAERPWHVEFTGRLPHAQTLAKIAEAHVLVQPSRVLETYGLTLIEALSAGTNILASDRGALREIVEDSGVGFVYNVEDPASLHAQVDAIRRCHADGSLNGFQLASFLDERSEVRYVDRLLRLYAGGADAGRQPALAA